MGCFRFSILILCSAALYGNGGEITGARSEVSDSTRAILAAQAFIRQFMTLDEESFIASLTENVVATHARVKNGIESNYSECSEKDSVVESYHKYFFAITQNFDVLHVEYKGTGLHAECTCDSSQNKIDEDGIIRKYHVVCNCHLDFIDQAGDLKLIRISERTSKDLIP